MRAVLSLFVATAVVGCGPNVNAPVLPPSTAATTLAMNGRAVVEIIRTPEGASAVMNHKDVLPPNDDGTLRATGEMHLDRHYIGQVAARADGTEVLKVLVEDPMVGEIVRVWIDTTVPIELRLYPAGVNVSEIMMSEPPYTTVRFPIGVHQHEYLPVTDYSSANRYQSTPNVYTGPTPQAHVPPPAHPNPSTRQSP